MILINLLPHRERRRAQRAREFYMMLGAAAFTGVVVVGLGAMAISAEIDAQRARNQLVQEENKKLDEEIQAIATLKQEIESLKARQNAVENLQADRTVPVQLMDQLVKLTPEGIYLRGIRQEGLKVAITGHAQSNERVSELLREFGAHPEWLERSDLVEIKAVVLGTGPRDSRRLYEFTVNALLKRPEAPGGDPAKAGKPDQPQKVAVAP